MKILAHLSHPLLISLSGSWSGAFRAGAQIYRDGGFVGLFQGHSATLLRIFPYAAIKFMAYDQLEGVSCHETMLLQDIDIVIIQILMPTRDKQTNVRRFTAGALSGVSYSHWRLPSVVTPQRRCHVGVVHLSTRTHTCTYGIQH